MKIYAVAALFLSFSAAPVVQVQGAGYGQLEICQGIEIAITNPQDGDAVVGPDNPVYREEKVNNCKLSLELRPRKTNCNGSGEGYTCSNKNGGLQSLGSSVWANVQSNGKIWPSGSDYDDHVTSFGRKLTLFNENTIGIDRGLKITYQNVNYSWGGDNKQIIQVDDLCEFATDNLLTTMSIGGADLTAQIHDSVQHTFNIKVTNTGSDLSFGYLEVNAKPHTSDPDFDTALRTLSSDQEATTSFTRTFSIEHKNNQDNVKVVLYGEQMDDKGMMSEPCYVATEFTVDIDKKFDY